MVKLTNLQELALVIRIIQQEVYKHLEDYFLNIKKSNVLSILHFPITIFPHLWNFHIIAELGMVCKQWVGLQFEYPFEKDWFFLHLWVILIQCYDNPLQVMKRAYPNDRACLCKNGSHIATWKQKVNTITDINIKKLVSGSTLKKKIHLKRNHCIIDISLRRNLPLRLLLQQSDKANNTSHCPSRSVVVAGSHYADLKLLWWKLLQSCQGIMILLPLQCWVEITGELVLQSWYQWV